MLDSLFVHPAVEKELAWPLYCGSNQVTRALGMFKDGRLCVKVSSPGSSDFQSSLSTFDGTQFETLPGLSSVEGIGTNWHTFFQAQNGDWWLSSDKGTAVY